MRDYYQLLKLLRVELLQVSDDLSPEILTSALARNFGGNPEMLCKVLVTFHEEVFGQLDASARRITDPTKLPESCRPPLPSDLIVGNLRDPAARHLMLLTTAGSALELLNELKLLPGDKQPVVLFGSQFRDDQTDIYLVQLMNQVKLAMANGRVMILKECNNIYEALYDVLNQRYVVRKDAVTNEVTRMLRLAIGTRSQLCQVAILCMWRESTF